MGLQNIIQCPELCHYAFTEQGIAMLAMVLRTTITEEICIQIMDAFVAMRKYISSNLFEIKANEGPIGFRLWVK